ncbi:MAG: hypothetical protein E2598_06350 [Sphingobium sp.]|nr:hypothetical protein [Sphingobium sp.]
MKDQPPTIMTWKLALKIHGSFLAILGAVALLAEFSPIFREAKEACQRDPWALLICYLCWFALYGVKEFCSWMIRIDLAKVRRENRKSRRK